MYAVIQTGGKQYKVKAGDVIRVEKLDKKLGEEFSFHDVLMVGGDTLEIGTPTVKGAKVDVVVTRKDRGDKITILKRKRRKGYRRTIGHRQWFTELFVKSVTGSNGKSVNAETEPVIYDAEVAAKVRAEKMQKQREESQKAKESGDGVVEKKASQAKTKKVTKKAASKKGGTKKKKKSSGKKKAAKKSTKAKSKAK